MFVLMHTGKNCATILAHLIKSSTKRRKGEERRGRGQQSAQRLYVLPNRWVMLLGILVSLQSVGRRGLQTALLSTKGKGSPTSVHKCSFQKDKARLVIRSLGKDVAPLTACSAENSLLSQLKCSSGYIFTEGSY